MEGPGSPLPGRNGRHGLPTCLSRPAGTDFLVTRMSVTRVIERCPTCGVEHETPGDGTCEACGTPLRAWCRTHSRDIGWLKGSACDRCVEEEAVRSARLRRYAVPVEQPGARPTPPAGPPPVAPRAGHRVAPERRPARGAPGLTGRQKTVRRTLALLGGVAGGAVLFWGDRLPRDLHAVLVVPLVLGLTGAILYVVTELLSASGTREG